MVWHGIPRTARQHKVLTSPSKDVIPDSANSIRELLDSFVDEVVEMKAAMLRFPKAGVDYIPSNPADELCAKACLQLHISTRIIRLQFACRGQHAA